MVGQGRCEQASTKSTWPYYIQHSHNLVIWAERVCISGFPTFFFQISTFISKCIDFESCHTRQLTGDIGSSDSKASAYNAGDPGLIPGSGRSPEEGSGNPLQYSCLEKPMDWGSWQATVHGVAKSWTWLSDFTLFWLRLGKGPTPQYPPGHFCGTPGYHLNDRKAVPLIDCWNWSVSFCLPSLFIAIFFPCSLTFLSLSKGITEPPEGTKIYKDSWDFGPYLKILNAAVGDEIFRHSSWIKEYFTWAGFKDYNLVVRVCLWNTICLCFPVLWKYMKTPSYSNLFLNKHLLSPTICLTENRWDNVLK